MQLTTFLHVTVLIMNDANLHKNINKYYKALTLSYVIYRYTFFKNKLQYSS